MLDINLFRADKGGNPELVRQSQRRRFDDEQVVDRVIELDARWRKLRYESEQLNSQLNSVSKQVAALKKSRPQDGHTSVEELVQRSRALKQQVAEARQREQEAAAQRDEVLCTIGNLVHDDVPVAQDEANNLLLREAGDRRPREDWMSNHPDLVQKLGMANLEAGQEVAGSRGYYLLGHGVMLNLALISYGLRFLSERGFEPVQTPYFMTRDVMAQCAQLSQFDDELYRIASDSDASNTGDTGHTGTRTTSATTTTTTTVPPPRLSSASSSSSLASASTSSSSSSAATAPTPPGANDKYLVATSEQPLCALHRKGWFEPSELPRRYAGLSTCFRREAGSHGKDTLGIFRVHQFDKVEQFCIASPEGGASSRLLDEMMVHAQDFYRSLGIPYRVVSVVSGVLNKSAAKKYDLEGWFPASQAYRELVSASNCTDYQARRLDIRLRQSSPAGSAASLGSSHVHMLNATLTATQRTLCCVLENHQTRDGVVVPEVLRPYVGGLELLPFPKAAAAAARLLRSVPK